MVSVGCFFLTNTNLNTFFLVCLIFLVLCGLLKQSSLDRYTILFWVLEWCTLFRCATNGGHFVCSHGNQGSCTTTLIYSELFYFMSKKTKLLVH